MDKLVRIKSIDNFRFYKNYRWNKTLKSFGQYNIIYGWNGCGKSTLSDFFFAIESDSLPPQTAFEICFQEIGKPESIITQNSLSTVANRFKVYHQQYAQGLISNPSNVKHISIIGHDAGKSVERIEELKKERTEWEAKLATSKSESAKVTRDFENYRKERATLIRSVTQFNQSYNYVKIYDRYKRAKKPIELSQSEYETLVIAVRATQKSLINPPKISDYTDGICNDVLAVLMESPIFTTIEKLQENPALRNWVQRGYDFHKDNNTRVCEFCNNPINPERWSDLEKYFSDSLSIFKAHIIEVLRQLEDCKGQYSRYITDLPHKTQFFDEFCEEYSVLREKAIAFCNNYIAFISKAIDLVKIKNERIIDAQCAEDFKTLMSTINLENIVILDIGKIISTHNKKVENYEKSIEEDKLKLEMHIIAQSAPRFIEYETNISENTQKQEQAKERIEKIKEEIFNLDKAVKDSRIPAKTINADIRFIFGHSDLHFEWKENGYEIKRNNEIATFLSTGEQNAIALIYFFNTLQDSGVTRDSCIVILDDPVSSFDSNYYYSAAAYIRNKLQNIGQAFILTHKFTLFKDFSRMFSGRQCYLLEREDNKPSIKEEDAFLHDYEDEYVYLFYKIYQFVKQPPVSIHDYLPYPNMGRRLLEGFVSFKLPEKYSKRDILEKALEMDGDGNAPRIRALTRLVQNKSHLRLVGSHDSVDNILDIKQLPEIFQHLLDFIEEHDPMHYSTLVKQIDPDKLTEDTNDRIDDVLKTIPLFEIPVSAGFGNDLDTYEPSEPYDTVNSNADFALKITGDSMEPRYCNGDIVLVKKQEVIDNAQIGIVEVDGVAFCKRIITTEEYPILVSLNKSKYPPRKIKEGERFDILGVVIDVEKKSS